MGSSVGLYRVECQNTGVATVLFFYSYKYWERNGISFNEFNIRYLLLVQLKDSRKNFQTIVMSSVGKLWVHVGIVRIAKNFFLVSFPLRVWLQLHIILIHSYWFYILFFISQSCPHQWSLRWDGELLMCGKNIRNSHTSLLSHLKISLSLYMFNMFILVELSMHFSKYECIVAAYSHKFMLDLPSMCKVLGSVPST